VTESHEEKNHAGNEQEVTQDAGVAAAMKDLAKVAAAVLGVVEVCLERMVEDLPETVNQKACGQKEQGFSCLGIVLQQARYGHKGSGGQGEDGPFEQRRGSLELHHSARVG